MVHLIEKLALFGAVSALGFVGCSSSPNQGTTTGTGVAASTGRGTTGAVTSGTATGKATTGGGQSTGAVGTSTGGTTGTAAGSTTGATTGGLPPVCNNGSDAGTLFDCYGGASTVQEIVNQAVTGLLADCVTAPYFANVALSGDTTPGFETGANLKACLNLFFAAALGGPAHYPGVTGPEYDSSGNSLMGSVSLLTIDGGYVYDTMDAGFGGYMCSGMRDAHSNAASMNADLGITPEAFDEFVIDVGAVLASDGVAAADIKTIAGAVSGFKNEVVSYYPQAFTACVAGDGGLAAHDDAGVSGYPGGELTLWTKYGGGPTISTVVGQAEGKLTTDCVTSPYFYGLVQGQPGYETLGNLTACLNQFFTAAFSGPASYPGVTPTLPAFNSNGTENFGYIAVGNNGNMTDGGGYYFDNSFQGVQAAIGTNAQYNCENMFSAHNALPDGGGNPELGITSMAFDEFVTDVAGILAADQVASTDIAPLGAALNSFKDQVVQDGGDIVYYVCDGGSPAAGVDGGN